MRKLYTYDIRRGWLHAALLLLLLTVGGVADMRAGNTRFARLTASTSATGKGLVYADADSAKTAPADKQYTNSVTVDYSSMGDPTADVTFHAWAKPARGYVFSSWTADNATVVNADTTYAVTITASAQGDDGKNNPTTGTVTANWSDDKAYAITYKQPENKGEYSVRYDYTTIANNAFVSDGATYDMTTSTADKTVTSYAADQVTFSTSLPSFLGWYEGDTLLSTEKTYVYTVSKEAIITARFEAPKEYQASVTSNGETKQYKTLQEALRAANKLTTNPTVTLLDNITDMNQIDTISKSMTFDLNGYTLMGAGGRRSPKSTSDLSKELLLITGANITVTITDNSTAKTGTISCTDEINHDLYTIFLNSAGQTLNLDGGTIHCENTAQYSTTDTSQRRMRTKAVYVGAGRTVNLNGASIEAVADYYAYGILDESSNFTTKSTVNVSGGSVSAKARRVVRTIETRSNLNVTGGTIEANTSTGDCYAILLNAYASQSGDTAKAFHATLKMSDGIVKATSSSTDVRGIRVSHGLFYKTNTNELLKEEYAVADITGGTISGETTTTAAYPLESYGKTNVSGDVKISSVTGTNDAHAVRVITGKTVIKGNPTIIATAGTSAAYGVIVSGDTDWSKGTPFNAEVQIEGGTISATTKNGANARGVFVHVANREITSTASGYYKGVYAAAGKATISGGKISATASTSGAYAVYLSATTTKTSSSDASVTASSTPTCSITGGMFISSGTNAACVNNAASSSDFTITGGYYQQKTNIATYISDTQTVYNLTSTINSEAYTFGCRYYVSPWDNTKEIALNQSTNTTYTSLSKALSEATSGQNVVLINDYRMTDAATVKSGVTLLIPFDADYTCYTSGDSKPTTTNTKLTPSAYCTLMMGAGAKFTVDGSISVSAGMYSAGGSQSGGGAPNGPYGLIKMSEGSSITINDGGNLYAWGYISGDGRIEANSGANVYEGFQINDFRGGNSSSATVDYNFPFSQYYIQNIEAYLTLHYGATEHVYTSLYASSATRDTNFDLIGSTTGKTGMFRLESGTSLTKHYDAENDRQEYSMTGNAELNSINMKLASLTVNSSNYILPISNNMGITMNGGTLTVNQKVALLPGTQVTINKDASMVVAKDQDLYVYDQSQWGNYTLKNRSFVPVVYTVAKHKTRTADDLVDAKINVRGTITATGNFYTTESGADICSDEEGKVVMTTVPSNTTTTWSQQSGSDGRSASKVTINVTAAQLHNGDGSYEQTSGAAAGTTYYYNVDTEKWQKTEPVLHPTFSLADGTTYDEEQTLELANRTDGATIKYSTDGGTTWTDYSSAITLKGSDGEAVSTTVQAKAVKDGTESTTVTATYTVDLSKRPVFAYDSDNGAFKLTNQGIVTKAKLESALTQYVTTGTLLSVDLTSGTCDLGAATLRNLISVTLGGKVGSNMLLYINEATAAKEATEATKNVVVKGSNGSYTAGNFVVTDKQPLCVPTAFTATSLSYSRTNTAYDGTLQWGTICLPFALTSGDMQYYELKSIKDDQMTFTATSSVAANTPAVYSVKSGADISISGSNVSVAKTESGSVTSGSYTLHGVQSGIVTLAHGTSSPYYYISQNKFWQPTTNDVTIRPQRAYFEGTAAAKVFSIGVDDGTATGIGGPSVGEAAITGIYSVNGMRQGELRKGVNIVRFSDGTTRKVVIK